MVRKPPSFKVATTWHTLGFETPMCRATSTERTMPFSFWSDLPRPPDSLRQRHESMKWKSTVLARCVVVEYTVFLSRRKVSNHPAPHTPPPSACSRNLNNTGRVQASVIVASASRPIMHLHSSLESCLTAWGQYGPSSTTKSRYCSAWRSTRNRLANAGPRRVRWAMREDCFPFV